MKPVGSTVAPGSARITLKRPAAIDGVQITHLQLRRPKPAELVRIAQSTMSRSKLEIVFFARLANVSPKLIKSLDLADYLEVQKTVSALAAAVLTTRHHAKGQYFCEQRIHG